ncbi:MAG TPA: cupin domain-containing protein [Candidatus Limnocylindrales bacterium]|nr:cupin domain-containing protein [Candidatus Limnocylindrales bacterium]
MLHEWLPELGLDGFRRTYLGRAPYSRASVARRAAHAFDWISLDRYLSTAIDPDILVISRGKLVEEPPPRSLEEMRAMFARGIGIVVRHPQRQCRELAALCDELARDMPGRQRVLIFATPRGVHGFGWHYDAEEVFIVQTAGEKEYYFRYNTIDPDPRFGAQPDFSTIRAETTPLMSCTLWPGDWLYLPRGMWHVAQPLSHSLSISIGVY